MFRIVEWCYVWRGENITLGIPLDLKLISASRAEVRNANLGQINLLAREKMLRAALPLLGKATAGYLCSVSVVNISLDGVILVLKLERDALKLTCAHVHLAWGFQNNRRQLRGSLLLFSSKSKALSAFIHIQLSREVLLLGCAEMRRLIAIKPSLPPNSYDIFVPS